MKRMRACLGACLLVLAAGAAEDPAARYFDETAAIKVAPTNFVLRVRIVETGFPAAAAGLQAGDLLFAVDGMRVRDYRDLAILRMFDETRPDMTLTIARHGEIKDLRIPQTRPIRRGGFAADDVRPNFLKELGRRDVNLACLEQGTSRPGAPETNNAVEVADANGPANSRLFTEAENSMLALPARVQEALLVKASTGGPSGAQWVSSFLDTFHLLTEEKWSEAAKRLQGQEPETPNDAPFLRDLLSFYSRIAAKPPRAGTRLSAENYGVDIPFFALCYPCPLCREDRPAFSSDPLFQKYFDWYFSGDSAFQSSLSSAAYRYTSWSMNDAQEEGASSAERYIAQVKAAIICEQEHGGWPFRSVLIYDKPDRARVVAALKKRLVDKPQEAAITAIAMIAPTAIDDDAESFKRAYKIAAAAGPRVTWVADRILKGTCRYWPNHERDKFVQALLEFDGSLPLPDYYRCLMAISPVFQYRISHAVAVSGPRDSTIPIRVCWSEPLVVVKALQNPCPAETQEYTAEALVSDDPAESAKALAQLTAEMVFCPGNDYIQDLATLSRKPGAGKVLDALTHVLFYRANLGVADQLELRQIRTELFEAVEKNRYARVSAEVGALDVKNPKLAEKLGACYAKWGVPSVCVLISAKLHAAGQNEAADDYARKVVDFYDAAAAAWGDTHIYRLALRDFVSIPGFEPWIGKYLSPENASAGLDSTFILKAIVDAYREQTESVVEDLVRSCQPNLERESFTYLYRGRLCQNSGQLRSAVLDELLQHHALSDEHIARLRQTRAPEILSALAQTAPDK